jgi:rhodanese-related sulfurtransferase
MSYTSLDPQKVSVVIKNDPMTILLDVRTLSEHDRMHIVGDMLIPLNELEERHGELDKDKKIIVYCASGNRSQIACDYLAVRGYACVNMTGGIGGWYMSGLAVV